jgi:DNA modification methylase
MARKMYGDQVVPQFTLLKGDCLETLKTLEDNSIDSVLCDPPYHLQSIVDRYGDTDSAPPKFGTDGAFQRSSRGFMGKTWDGGDIAFRTDVWKECLRVLKPGGHLVAFGGTRTMHRITCAIEDSGFQVRDQLHWIYFSGFPKNHNISKAIDKAAGAERKVLGARKRAGSSNTNSLGVFKNSLEVTKPATPEAEQWSNWGTALKPACEPACLARKPLEKGLTIAENVLKWGTGGINIEESRFAYGDPCWVGPQEIGDPNRYKNTSGGSFNGSLSDDKRSFDPVVGHPLGRWPANIYQCPKPSRAEKEAGLDHLVKKTGFDLNGRKPENVGHLNAAAGTGRTSTAIANTHPTIKPTKLFEWIAQLITPPGGVILDPFLGSGTTAVSGLTLGFDVVGCELTEEYWPIIEGRVNHALKQWYNANAQYKLF